MIETQKNVEADHQRYMDGINRNINNQAIELRIQIEEAKLNRALTDDEKQEIVNAQLARPGSRAGGGGAEHIPPGPDGRPAQQRRPQQQQEEESSSVSSDWDDWQDPDYIEEQREALQEFSRK